MYAYPSAYSVVYSLPSGECGVLYHENKHMDESTAEPVDGHKPCSNRRKCVWLPACAVLPLDVHCATPLLVVKPNSG